MESTLGFGGMGLVIKAHNLDLDESVAIKLLREDVQVDEENVTRFVREAKNAVKLKSEHVARIRDVGTFEDGRPYMVMELLEGLDLGKLLLDHGKLDRASAVDLLLQACDAIGEAHSLGIVHRDLKPTNLFVTRRRDGTDLLKVLDFGISKAQMGPDMSLTQTQSMLGTPAYMSPEQMRSARTVDRRSDIWSLGCVLYELVEGHAPFEATNFAELCVMVSIEPFTPLVAAPELTPVIERVLAKHVDGRYQDIADFAYALQPYASDQERAYRQVARVFRVLGRSHPEGRDSTPTPMPRPPSRGSEPRLSYPAIARTPAPTVARISRGMWKAIAFLAVLFSVGIVVGLFVMGGDDMPASAAGGGSATGSGSAMGSGSGMGSATDTSATGTGSPSGGQQQLDTAGSASPATEMTVDRDAGVAVLPADVVDASMPTVPVDAGSSAAAGSANPIQKPRPPIRKPAPPRKPAKPPVKPATPASTGSAAPAPPPPPPPPPPPTKPKPKCDPFDNPKGCK